MLRCSSCNHSRWVYLRFGKFAADLEWLTGFIPYGCQGCGRRGWHRVRATPPAFDDLRRALARSAAKVRGGFAAAMARVTLRPSARWVVPAIALGLLLGGLLLSGATTGTGPAPLTLADAAVHPPAPNPPATPPVGPPPRSESMAAEEERGSQPTATAPPASRAPEAVTPKAASPAKAAHSTRRSPVRYRGSLAISSEPDGALVSVDGRVVGSTPLVLKSVPAGSRVVRIESQGYERWSFAARVVANQVTQVVATLQRESQ